jgi:hypothetical protein
MIPVEIKIAPTFNRLKVYVLALMVVMISRVKIFGIPLENHGPSLSQLPPSPFPPNPDFER